MFFIFLILLSCIPVCVGITLLVLFKKNKLSKIIFLLLLMVSFWQLDVAFLHSYNLFKEETVLFFFNLFRFGSIMITPTIFYIGYTIVQDMLTNEFKKKWRFLVNRTTVLLLYALSVFVYVIGWNEKGISGLELIKNGANPFYFPVYGELAWIFNSNVLLFIVSMSICFLISLNIQNRSIRSFLVYFNIFSSIGYAIGILNMFPSTRLYPSSIALLVYTLSIIILSNRLHLDIVNNMNKKLSEHIAERKQYEEEIKFQANHDALTGLPNRRMFNEDLTNLVEKARTEESQNAIMFLDLDRFKYINDTLGHDVGDLLLIEVSRRIENLLKKRHSRAVIYRLGGDEFTILLPHYNATDSEALAKELLEQFKEVFIIDGSEYIITPSIGISIFPNDGDDANTLIKHADTAMYYVKERGKNNYQLFTSEMQRQFYRKMMIENQLRIAIENNEFELYYQPIIDLKTNKLIGMESLIRWNNKILGRVSPDELISIAEETGMIIPIGQWVLNTAIKQNARWQKEGHQPLKISINVSVKQLINPNFVENVKSAIENNAIDASYIVLEITESIAMYGESMVERLCVLKELGISLSMDDFGTGYSSLSYLKKYPLDSLKIDKAFVIGMNRDDENKAIVKTILVIAKELDLKVIAEGVEGHEEYQYLTEIGCDYAQGYIYGRPLSVVDFKEKWLQSGD